MDKILSQKTMPWGNMLLGKSKYYIHAVGSEVTLLADILSTTPDIISSQLDSVAALTPSENELRVHIEWDKISEAFPPLTASYFTPYDNDVVLKALSERNYIIVEVDAEPLGNPGGIHAVRYIGNGLCYDPWDGTGKPTKTYPGVKGFIVISHKAKGGESKMAKLFKVVVTTQATREVNVLAETAEEAQSKVELKDGEVVVGVQDEGDVVA